MPFGAFKGQPLEAVPYDTLEYYPSWPKLFPATRKLIAAELERRQTLCQGTVHQGRRVSAAISACYRELALEFHPDRPHGRGSNEAMIAVNAAIENVRRTLSLQ
jgi:hypothetical protein